MPLTLISGRSGKTRAILERLAPFAKNQTGICVVPSEAAAFELRQLLLSDNESILGDVFIPYNHFIRKLADTDLPIISQREQMLLLHKNLRPLSYFKFASLGIARQAGETITTLKKNLITPKILADLISSRASRREKDLLTLFERYEKDKTRLKVLDEGDLVLLAVEKIKKGAALADTKFLAFDEFHHFSPGQLNLIGMLSGRIETVVSFPTSDDTVHAAYLDGCLKSLKKLASNHILIEGETNRPAIRNVVLRSPLQEVRYIAQEIGRARKKIAVCLRRGDQTLMDILSEAKRYGLVSHPHKLSAPFSAPIIHEALQTIEHLPDSAAIDEFSKIVMTQLKKKHEGASWESITDSVSRSQIALASIEQILNSLSTSSKLLSLEEISREKFLDILLHECQSNFISASDMAQVAQFQIAYFEDGLTTAPDVTIVPQMIEGKIPALVHDRLFFSTQDDCQGPLCEIFPSPEKMLAEESFLFHRIMAKTKTEVILTHPAIDDSSNEVTPSSFLDPFGTPCPIEVQIPVQGKHLDRITAIEQERLLGDVSHPSYHGRIEDKDVKAMIKKRFSEKPLSPSRIETYAACPFRFFVESVLNLKPPEEITPDIRPKDLGTIVHKILELFFRENLFKKAVSDDTIDIEHIIDKLVDRVFKEHEEIVANIAKGLFPNARRAAHVMATQVISMEINTVRALPEPMWPIACEWTFGEKPETALKLEGPAPALISGRVDRIDASDDHKKFAVIDYKTGKNVGSVMSKIKKGLHVQLPLYVEAVSRLMLPKALPLGGALLAVQLAEKKHGFLRKDFNDINFSISKRSHSILDDDAWEEAMKTALSATRAYVAAIRDANFEVRPKECSEYCDYGDVCRYNAKGADEISAQGDSVNR